MLKWNYIHTRAPGSFSSKSTYPLEMDGEMGNATDCIDPNNLVGIETEDIQESSNKESS